MQKRRRFVFGMLFLMLLNLADIIYHNTIRIDFVDLQLYWEEFRVTIKGYDTGFFYHAGEKIPGVATLPAIPIFPWGRILGNLICPAFLPYGIAKWYTFALLVVLCMLTGMMGYKHILGSLRKVENCDASKVRNELARENKSFLIIAMILVFFMPFYWRDMITFFNIGGVICFLLILMVFVVEEHPYFAALLLAISMMKPQNAVPFVIILLLEKRWKTVFSAAGLDVIAWLFTAIWTGVNPVNQVLYIYGRSTDAEPYYFWFGLLDPLRNVGYSSNVAMVLSMVLGMVILVLLYFAVKNNPLWKDNVIAIYAGAAVISTVWMYKSKSDFVIVVLASMFVLQYYLVSLGKMESEVAPVERKRLNSVQLQCIGMLALLNVLIFTEPIRVLLGYSFTTGMTLDAWCRLLAVVWVTLACTKQERGISR